MLTCLLLVTWKKKKKKKSAQILALRTQALHFPFACDFVLFESLLARDKKTPPKKKKCKKNPPECTETSNQTS